PNESKRNTSLPDARSPLAPAAGRCNEPRSKNARAAKEPIASGHCQPRRRPLPRAWRTKCDMTTPFAPISEMRTLLPTALQRELKDELVTKKLVVAGRHENL